MMKKISENAFQTMTKVILGTQLASVTHAGKLSGLKDLKKKEKWNMRIMSQLPLKGL